MARPHLRPRSGFYWLRKRVPADLVGVVGKREEVFSLRTRDPAVAKRRHAEEVAKLEERWAGLRKGSREGAAAGDSSPSPRQLTERDAHDHAAWLYRSWLDQHRANPSRQTFWPTDLYDVLWPEEPPSPRVTFDLWSPSSAALTQTTPNPRPHSEEPRLAKLRQWCLDQADDLIAVHDWTVDDPSRLRLAKALGAAVQRASLLLTRFAEGDHSGDPASGTKTSAPRQAVNARKPITFEALLSAWAAERNPAPKTVYEWSRVVRQFTAHLGRDDATTVTPDDVVGWKDSLVEKGLKAKTINNSHLAALRTILQWATDNRRLPSNPAERVSIDVKRTAAGTIRGFTEEEAATILRAALRETNPVLRWVPWLCAYSGARVSEVCQLRVSDIRQIDGIWCMRFDPDAGPLKTASSERAVPLHPAVVDGGFLAYVEGVKVGPLFPKLPPDKFGKRGGNGTKVLGRWVRKLGLTDPRLAPNHSWRHRMRTLGRRLGLAPDIVDAITGHGRRTVADAYGEYEMTALDRELRKISMQVGLVTPSEMTK